MKNLFIFSLIMAALLFQNCTNGFKASSAPKDPLQGNLELKSFWYISMLDVESVWSSGVAGSGVQVLISDDGVESNHEDLKDNFNFNNRSRNYTLAAPYVATVAEPIASTDNHGTAVAGLIAAVKNSVGIQGIAYYVKIAIANFLSDDVTQTISAFVNQAASDTDVVNQSWGDQQQYLEELESTYKTQLQRSVSVNRLGKGTIFVKAGGNDFTLKSVRFTNRFELGNSNFDSTSTTPYTINVGALNADEIAASYSSPGANIWISAYGGQDGVDEPALVTTDRTGCTNGYSKSSAEEANAFDLGSSENPYCSYTSMFNGTSGAAPQVTGAVALLLSVNPNLTWRDVKYILAKSAARVHTSLTNFENPLFVYNPTSYARCKSPTGYTYEQGWILNAAGFRFHNWYGFGKIDIAAAVNLARSYTSPFSTLTETNFANKATGLSTAIPDNSATGVTSQINVTSALKIEAIQIRTKITHANVGELALELTSPSGTKSIIVNMNNALDGIADYTNETLLTNAFYREPAGGVWTLKVIDGRTGNTGTLTEWSLNILGSL